MTTPLSTIEETLVAERETALQAFSQKLTEAEAAAMEYNRMDAAIAALTGTPKEDAVTALRSGKKRKTNGSNGKKHATKEQVLPVLKAIVKENPGIAKAEVEEITKRKLKESGLGINGASSQIRKYLAEQPFQIDDSERVTIDPN
ncbi:hypothetical protein [Thalassoglobus sp.]|uniref:hypothetical protein n=1 Tax=Thalassoglobus sp. TaxID=2795869 RepID=UPI003AA8B2C8